MQFKQFLVKTKPCIVLNTTNVLLSGYPEENCTVSANTPSLKELEITPKTSNVSVFASSFPATLKISVMAHHQLFGSLVAPDGQESNKISWILGADYMDRDYMERGSMGENIFGHDVTNL